MDEKREFRLLFEKVKPYSSKVLFALFLGVLGALFKTSSVKIFEELIHSWETRDTTYGNILPIALAAAWVVSSVFRYFSAFQMKLIAEKIGVGLRKNLMDKYLDLNLSYLNSFMRGSGGLISRMINDISQVQLGLMRVVDIAREPITAVIMLVYLLTIDWKLLIFIFATFPPILIILRSLSRSLRKYGNLSMESMEDLTKTLKEALDGARIVQSFNLQEMMRNKFSAQADEYLASRTKIVSREELTGPSSESLVSISLAAILTYIGAQIFEGKMTLAEFTAFQFALAMIGDSFRKSQGAYVKIQQSLVAMGRYTEILEHGHQVPEASNPMPYPENWQTLNYEDVSFQYEEGKPVLNKINLQVKRGEVVALVGSSGGGKSTMVNLLGRFFEPTSGQIKLDDTPISSIRLSEYRDHVGLVSQDVFLFSDSIKSNIHAGDFNATDGQIKAAAKLANAHNFIENTIDGYDSLCGERGTRLSGGEKQRISIARAILKDAPVLILDEATSALDNESEKEVQKGLSELMKGRTTFVIAHRLSTVENADRILVMKDGQIVEDGTHKELINRGGEYTRLQNI